MRHSAATDRPEETYLVRDQARAFADLIHELGVTNAIVAGYDVGSFASQTLAATGPDLVKALVVLPLQPDAGAQLL